MRERGDADDVGGTPWRLACCVVAVAASLAVAAAGWWAHSADNDGAELGRQLSTDQALCMRLGFITARSDAYHLNVALGSYSTLDPGAGARLRVEVRELDGLVSVFPAADPRLVRSIGASADAGKVVLAEGGRAGYRQAVSARAADLAVAETLCGDVAGFDTEALRLEPGGADG